MTEGCLPETNTTKAIARECVILTDGITIDGPVFREKS